MRATNLVKPVVQRAQLLVAEHGRARHGESRARRAHSALASRTLGSRKRRAQVGDHVASFRPVIFVVLVVRRSCRSSARRLEPFERRPLVARVILTLVPVQRKLLDALRNACRLVRFFVVPHLLALVLHLASLEHAVPELVLVVRSRPVVRSVGLVVERLENLADARVEVGHQSALGRLGRHDLVVRDLIERVRRQDVFGHLERCGRAALLGVLPPQGLLRQLETAEVLRLALALLLRVLLRRRFDQVALASAADRPQVLEVVVFVCIVVEDAVRCSISRCELGILLVVLDAGKLGRSVRSRSIATVLLREGRGTASACASGIRPTFS